ncbi:MAG: zf-TFIIB domain-containing protein [Nannocystis sp.]|jgi:hypothetical protein|nr:zf-TFIIB domain-containing protein [Nannocystis sp.]
MSRRADDDSELEIRQELARRRELVRERQSQLLDGERERLKKLHWMRCPKCGLELSEVEFRAVRVDKCFACGGVYLDDGELEQLTGKPGWFDGMLRFFRGV